MMLAGLSFRHVAKRPFLCHFSTSIDTKRIAHGLEHDNHETRDAMKELFRDPLFRPRYNISLDAERDLAYDRLKKLCDQKLISVTDFRENPSNIFSAHEVAGVRVT